MQKSNAQHSPDYKSFTTRHIPSHERIEYWEAHNSNALIGLDIRTMHDTPLMAEQHNRQLPAVRSAYVKGSAQLVERTPDLIRRFPTDDVALFFCLDGDSFFSSGHGTEVLRSGEVLACNADSSFVRGFGSGVSEMVLTVSMEEFLKISGGQSLPHPKKFTFGLSPGAQPRTATALRVATWVQESLQQNNTSPEAAQDACLDSLERLFNGAGSSSAQVYEIAQHFLHENLGNANLRRADLAQRLSLSERQVARLFAAHDTSFSRDLMLKRVEQARTLLFSEPHTSIAELARRCGFRTTSHFSRTFREFTGHRPSEARLIVLQDSEQSS